jgi:hypothetical protein
MKDYAKLVLFSNLSEILSPEDAERALELGCDEAMNFAEYALRYRPFALKRARQLYVSTCLLLYRAGEEASR